MTKAQRDNDLIYHQDIPPVSALEIIEPAVLVNSVILGGLKDPQTALNGEDALFGTLTSWGARTAIGTSSPSVRLLSLLYLVRNIRRTQKECNCQASTTTSRSRSRSILVRLFAHCQGMT